jgi:hypothetical protein
MDGEPVIILTNTEETEGSRGHIQAAEGSAVAGGDDVVLYIGAGWDTEPLAVCPNCRRFVFVDCIPNRFLYWKEGECGYEIAHSLEMIVGIMRYKLAMFGLPVKAQTIDSAEGKPRVHWTLSNDTEITYFFDIKFPDDLPQASVPAGGSLGAALTEVNALFMKGYPPQPFSRLLAALPGLATVYSTQDNISSVQQELGEAALGAYAVHVVTDFDIEAARQCGDSFELLQKTIHNF